MKIIVLVKQVPSRDAVIRVAADGERLDESALLTYETNGPDTYALECGLDLRDAAGGEVVVLSVGPDRVAQTIREALAKGADRGIHIRFDKDQPRDSFAIASLISRAVKAEAPDLVLAGLQSEDDNSGQVGVVAAELLQYAHSTLITSVEPLAGAVRVKRELEGGWSQQITLPLPAVLTVQSSQQKPRLATLPGIKQAKTKDIRVIPASSLKVKQSAPVMVERLYLPQQKKSASMLHGDARECARQLIEQLRQESRVL